MTARGRRRARLDAWVDEQVRAQPGRPKRVEVARFRVEVVRQAACTWLNRLVYLRLEGMKLRPSC